MFLSNHFTNMLFIKIIFSIDNENLVLSFSSAIQNTALNGIWIQQVQNNLNGVNFEQNFPVQINTMGYPTYTQLKSNLNDYLYTLIAEADPTLTKKQKKGINYKTPIISMLQAHKNFEAFSKQLLLASFQQLCGNYLNKQLDNSLYQRRIDEIQKNIYNAKIIQLPIAKTNDSQLQILFGPISNNPINSQHFTNLAFSIPFIKTNNTFAIRVDTNATDLKQLYTDVQQGHVQINFCSFFNITNITYVCGHQLLDKNFYKVLQQCNEEGNKVTFNSQFQSLDSATQDTRCDLIVGEEVLLSQYSNLQTFRSLDIGTNVYQTTFSFGFTNYNVNEYDKGNEQLIQLFSEAKLQQNNQLVYIFNQYSKNQNIMISTALKQYHNVQQSTHQFISYQHFIKGGILDQIIFQKQLNVVALNDTLINGKQNIEFRILEQLVQKINDFYNINININLNIIDYKPEFSTDQNMLIYNMMSNCPSTGFDCENITYDVAIGLLNRNNIQQNVTFGEKLLSGYYALFGDCNNLSICVVPQNIVSSLYENEQGMKFINNQNYTEIQVDNYKYLVDKVKNKECMYYGPIELGLEIQKQVDFEFKFQNITETYQYSSMMFRKDLLLNKYQKYNESNQTLIKISTGSVGMYYGNIIMIYVTLSLIILPVIAILILCVTKQEIL